MRFELTFKTTLRQLHPDGTSDEIVGVSRIESFEGDPKDFKDYYVMVGYEVDCVLDREFEKQFPMTSVEDDQIPF